MWQTVFESRLLICLESAMKVEMACHWLLPITWHGSTAHRTSTGPTCLAHILAMLKAGLQMMLANFGALTHGAF